MTARTSDQLVTSAVRSGDKPGGAGGQPGGAVGEADRPPRHYLGVTGSDPGDIRELLRLADRFAEVNRRPIPKVPALRGKTVVNMFFEDSTRTRLSFDTAARRLSADVVTFSAATSSLNKGESLRDTVETVESLGADALVVRHSSSGVPWQIASWVNRPSVVNAGDGWHEHPTQALLDCYTVARRSPVLCDRYGPDSDGFDFRGLRVGIVGDVSHSRVARSDVAAMTALGAEVTLVGPPTLMPPSLAGWPVEVSNDLDSLIGDLDVCYLLRLQRERTAEALLPSLREYRSLYGLTDERADRLRDGALVMHPGPANLGVEIDAGVTRRPCSVIGDQVANGVSVRMAVLYFLLGSGVDLVNS